MADPWREVQYIGEQTGARGGVVWVLTLDCGHLAFRAKPGRKVNAMFRPIRFAPHRVRCLLCGLNDNPPVPGAKE